MPIRNMWSLQPGECLTAEKLAKIVEVFFPLHDVGVDLLVVERERHMAEQPQMKSLLVKIISSIDIQQDQKYMIE